MKETLPERIRTAIASACDEAAVSLIDVVVRGQARQLVLDVFIDAVDGVTHEHCRNVSRGIDERLAEDEYAGRLRAVDVSSPGAEAPVKHLWQLTKHVGRTVRVRRKDGVVIDGVLLRADESGLDVQPKQSKKQPIPPVSIVADEVEEAMVRITF